MKFKDGCKLFWCQFPIFFVFGLVLLSGFEFYNDVTKKFLEDSFFEHFAMKSIVLIFLLCLLISGTVLLCIGKNDKDNKLHVFIYDYIVRPPVELGITLSSVAFSLSASLVIILLFVDTVKAVGLAIGLINIIVVAVFYWLLSASMLDDKFLKTPTEKRISGLVMIAVVPVIAWFVIPKLIEI